MARESTLGAVVRARVETTPDAIMLVAPSRPPLTFAALEALVARTRQHLGRLAVTSRDRVALVLPDSPETIAATIAVASHAAAAPIHAASTAPEIAAWLSELRPAALITEPGSRAIAPARARGVPVLQLVRGGAGAPAGTFDLEGDVPSSRHETPGRPDASDATVILQTSGTTARPRLVSLSHTHVLTSARAIADALDLTTADRVLSVMPLCHIHGLSAVLAALVSGGSIACDGAFVPAAFLDTVDGLCPTWVTAAPAFHHAILRVVRAQDGPVSTTLRFVRSASAPLPAALADELEARLGVPVIEAYGMTEASPQIASQRPDSAPRTRGSVGRPAGPEVAVWRRSGAVAPPGEVGEIVIRGANVCVPGWLRTGDLGRFDADGNLFVTGRVTDTINRGGEKIAPFEVEAAVLAHPAVSEAAAFAAPHPTLGETVAVAVVRRDGAIASEAEIVAATADRLAPFKRPQRVVFVDALPLTPSGKIDRRALAGFGDAPFDATGPTSTDTLSIDVRSIMAAVLGVESLAVDDNFFARGGDSLSGLEVLARVRERFSVDLPVDVIFGAPTPRALAQAVQAGTGAESATAVAACPDRVVSERALTAAESRLWVLDQVDPGDSAYNMQVAMDLEGALDLRVLERCLDEILRRHDALRTVFRAEASGPRAVIAEPRPCRVPVVDVSWLGAGDAVLEAQRLAEAELASPFVLARGPLFRVLLVRTGRASHRLLITVHHIVFDGWSRGVLCRDLTALYAAFTEGRPSPLAPPTVTMADIAAFERSAAGEAIAARDLDYWRRALGDGPVTLDLPRTGGRPPAMRRGARYQARLSHDVVAELRSFGERHDATLPVVTLAAFEALLSRFSGQDDFVIGLPVAARTDVAVHGTVGFFANTLALRSDLTVEMSFATLVARVRRRMLDALQHQHAHFDAVVNAMAPPRQPGRAPLVSVLFAFHNLPALPTALGAGVRVSYPSVDRRDAKFDLALHVTPGPEGLDLVWQYDADVFEAATVAACATSFGVLIDAAVDDAARPIASLPLDAGARAPSGDSPVAAAPAPVDVVTAFVSYAHTQPAREAVRCGAHALTYAELDRRSTRMAGGLRRRGVEPGAVVAVALPRSVDAVVAFMGVLKAGAVYLPLDPDGPRVRRVRALAESAARLLVVAAEPLEHEANGANGAEGPVETAAVEALCADDVPDVQVPATDGGGYIVYTSGSSGRPKAIHIARARLARYIAALVDRLGVDDRDRYLHTAPFGFSSSIRQMSVPLATGGSIVLAPTDVLRDAALLARTVVGDGVTVVDLVPSHWRTFTNADARAAVGAHRVRLALSASEPLSARLAADVQALFGAATRVVNMYGQTETAGIVMTCDVATEPVRSDVVRVPIGRPLAGVGAMIVDQSGRELPDGAVGELVLSGSQVDASATRTGDLARRHADGRFEWLGRRDGQVKIRGFRVDPLEIEDCIAADPEVRASAVTIDSRAAGASPVLVAHVVFGDQSGDDLDAAARVRALRSRLRASLPVHALPSAIVPVRALPRTDTGKVDYRALSGAVTEPSTRIAGDVPPAVPAPGAETDVEQALAGIWASVLRRDHVGPDENFFDIGGDSLLTVQVVDAARRLGIELRAADLFRHQTIAELARAMGGGPVTAELADGGDVRRVTIDSLRAFGREALERAGLSSPDAAAMTEIQIEASLRGQTTHNVGAIPRYARRLASGATNARPAIRVERESLTSALIDADNAAGQLAASEAMRLAMQKARAHGIGVVGVRRSNHFGAAGHYVWLAAREGLIGLCTTNSALWLPPTGGATPMFGTNPIAAGIPAGRHHPIVLDVSMSVTAKGKVALHMADGKPLAPGWIVDRHGRPSTDAADLAAGLGVPIGGHKGYGLALVMEVLAGVLTGAGFGEDHRRDRLRETSAPVDFGHFFIAIDPAAFMPTDEFRARVDRFIDQVKSARRIDDATEILVPGEREMRARQENLLRGVPVLPAAWRALQTHRAAAGISADLVTMDRLAFTRADIDTTIPDRFEVMALVYAHRPALRGNGRAWTYAELNATANRLAHAIQSAAGAGAGCVAYLVEHSPEMVIATLAVLKAGKTYLAIHPRMPSAAQAAMVADVRPDLIVTTAELEARARALGGRVLTLDAAVAGEAAGNPDRRTTPSDPSTIFYTSGTTGQPKAVMKSHRAVLHRVWLSTIYDAVTPDDRQSLLTHASFSASESDMFGALLQGATLCTFDTASHGLGAFREWLDRERVTLLHPPALFFRRFLATLDGAGLFPSVRVVALAGDVVLSADVRKWQKHFAPACVLLHRFSITETALLTVARFEHRTRVGPGLLEAGRPVPDKGLTLVDDTGAPVADGDVGELVVASPYLADGYWNRPDRTALAFTSTDGARTYRTGDLGRFTRDGVFVFLGRRDHQVKIRGYRVDMREVESALLQVDGITEAAVVAYRDGDEQHLAAYVVTRGRRLDAASVRAALRADVASWMIPARVVVVDALPVTFTGKVDRAALADAARVAPASGADIAPTPSAAVAPADAVAARVAAAMARVLRLSSVAPGDDFFDLGGNSLLFAELQLELESEFKREIALRDMLQHTTATSLATLLGRERAPVACAGMARGRLVPVVTEGARAPVFLVHGAHGHAVLGRPFLESFGGSRPVYAFQARGLEGADTPHDRIADMVTEYVAAVRAVQPKGPYCLGGTCAGGLVAIEMAVRLTAAGERVAPILLIDPASPRREQGALTFMFKAALLAATGQLARFRAGRRWIERRFLTTRRRAPGELGVWWRFRLAAYRHDPTPYSGEAYVIACPERLRPFHDGRWRRCLTGSVDLVRVNASHADIFAPSNTAALDGLRRYARVLEAWEAAQEPPGACIRRADARS